MSLSPSALVDVPCTVLSSGRSAVRIKLPDGRIRTLPPAELAGLEKDHVTVPAWLAQEERLLTTEACLDTDALARRFGRSRSWVTANLARLYAENFPQPVASFGRKRWDPSSVDAWFRRHHPAGPPPAPVTPAIAAPFGADDEAAEREAWRAELASAYGRRA